MLYSNSNHCSNLGSPLARKPDSSFNYGSKYKLPSIDTEIMEYELKNRNRANVSNQNLYSPYSKSLIDVQNRQQFYDMNANTNLDDYTQKRAFDYSSNSIKKQVSFPKGILKSSNNYLNSNCADECLSNNLNQDSLRNGFIKTRVNSLSFSCESLNSKSQTPNSDKTDNSDKLCFLGSFNKKRFELETAL